MAATARSRQPTSPSASAAGSAGPDHHLDAPVPRRHRDADAAALHVLDVAKVLLRHLRPEAHPRRSTLDNYIDVLSDGRFFLWFRNSIVIATIVTLSNVFFDSLVGYTLAKFEFRGRYIVFIAILSTLMIPTEMLVIPWYIMARNFGWLDTYWGIMFPA
jgi:ABC-type glycerol-3-phosphate transport system permease component